MPQIYTDGSLVLLAGLPTWTGLNGIGVGLKGSPQKTKKQQPPAMGKQQNNPNGRAGTRGGNTNKYDKQGHDLL